MMKRLEVQIPRRAGHPQDEVAKLTGVPVRTIRRIEAEDADALILLRRRLGLETPRAPSST